MNMHEMLTDLRAKKSRKTPCRLDEHEKWEVAKYLIENRLVQLDSEGRFTRFRNFEKDIITEINTLGLVQGKELTSGYHLKDSLDFYHTCCALTGNLPNVPIQDSVQEDMLKIELQKAMTERDNLLRKIDTLELLYAKVCMKLEDFSADMQKAYKNEYAQPTKAARKAEPVFTRQHA